MRLNCSERPAGLYESKAGEAVPFTRSKAGLARFQHFDLVIKISPPSADQPVVVGRGSRSRFFAARVSHEMG